MSNYMLLTMSFVEDLIDEFLAKDKKFKIKTVVVEESFLNNRKEIINKYPYVSFIPFTNKQTFLTKALSNIHTSESPNINDYFKDTNNLLNLLLISQRFSPNPLSIDRSFTNILLSIQWAHSLILNQKPSKILFPITPHDLLDYSIYTVAQSLKIECSIVKMLTYINDEKGFIVDNIYTDNINEINDLDLSSNNDLDSKIINNTENNIRNKLENALPNNGINNSNNILLTRYDALYFRNKLKKFIYKIIEKIGLKKYKMYDIKNFEMSIKESLSLLSSIKKTKKVLYFAYPYQPEVTSNPMTYPIFSTEAVVSYLRAILPQNWILIVKEHPGMVRYNLNSYSNYRSDMVSKIIQESDNTFLLNTKIKSSLIIEYSNAVISGVGSIGIEALMAGKPVISLGNSSYGSFENVYKCKTFSDIYNCLNLINKNSITKNNQNILRFKFLNRIKPSRKAGELINNQKYKSFNHNWQNKYFASLLDLLD